MPGSRNDNAEVPENPSNADLARMIAGVKSDVRRVERFITGDESPERGLLIQVDRLKQAHKSQQWWMRAGLGTAIAAFVMGLWDAVKSAGK